MSDETSRSAQWIYEVLHSDPHLMSLVSGIYELPAPTGTGFPLVAFSLVSAVDTTTGDTLYRILSRQIWTVRAVVEGHSYASAIPIADRIDALLQNSSGTADGAIIYHTSRESSLRMAEEVEGKQYRHLGGTYRIACQRLP